MVGEAGASMVENGIEILPQIRRRTPYARVAREILVTARGTTLLPGKTADYEVLVNGVVKRIITGVAMVKDGTTGEPDPSVVFLKLPTKALKKGDVVQVKTVTEPKVVSGEITWE
jgi:hypothetical protein